MVMSSKGSLRMVGARTLRGEIFQVRETLQKLEQGGMIVVRLGLLGRTNWGHNH